MVVAAPKFSTPQIRVLNSRKPITLNMAGQRSGKSHMIGFKTAIYVKNFPRMRGMVAANTYLQLTQSTLVACRKVWKTMFGITEYDRRTNPSGVYVVNRKPPGNFIKFEEYDNYHGIISFRNGAVVYAASLDNYMAHDGKELGWCELDETKDTKEDALKSVILGRLSQPGLYYQSDGTLVYSMDPSPDLVAFNPLTINTSPALGPVEWLNEMFNLGEYDEDILERITTEGDFFYHEDDDKAIIIYSTHWNEHNLPSNYIENRLKNLTESEALKLIYGYPFSKTGGEYYSYFERLKHIQDVPFLPDKNIHLTYDFNVLPYMTLLCWQINMVTRVLDGEYRTITQVRLFREYCLSDPFNTSTEVTLAFLRDHEQYIKSLFYYGDASGNNRIAGQGNNKTNFRDIETALLGYVNHGSNRVMKRNPGPLKRREFVQKLLKGDVYPIELLIDRSCAETKKDFQYLKLGKDGKLKERVVDKVTGASWEKYGHPTDAAEYFLCKVFEDLFLA